MPATASLGGSRRTNWGASALFAERLIFLTLCEDEVRGAAWQVTLLLFLTPEPERLQVSSEWGSLAGAEPCWKLVLRALSRAPRSSECGRGNGTRAQLAAGVSAAAPVHLSTEEADVPYPAQERAAPEGSGDWAWSGTGQKAHVSL